ncbi:MAG: BglII/BstYI family type II restriction endonuclease [Pirellulales bacterium]
MGLDLIPPKMRKRFQIEERRHACAILAQDFQEELSDILGCLGNFKLVRSEIAVGGGGRSKITERLDGYFRSRGWRKKTHSMSMVVDGNERPLGTHEIDNQKGRIAVEVEWNNKDPFFARDLNAFRLLHELDIISVGVIITRTNELQDIFDRLGFAQDKRGRWGPIGAKYRGSTTHWSKLMPLVNRGGGGACPLLLVGIRAVCYRDDIPDVPLVLTDPTK